jgi:DNA-binding NarL/FixJ family response regulator
LSGQPPPISSPPRPAALRDEVDVLLVEDDEMVQGWVRLALEGTEFRLAGIGRGYDDSLELAQRRSVDVLLLDYRLVDGVGTELLRQLRRVGVSAPALVMTASPSVGFNEQAREAGAQGTALKSGSVDELVASLRLVAGGGSSWDARHPRRAPEQAALSPRERDVLRLVAQGKTNREIATTLGVGSESVKTLLGRAFAKLGVHRRAEAVAAATKLGLI